MKQLEAAKMNEQIEQTEAFRSVCPGEAEESFFVVAASYRKSYPGRAVQLLPRSAP